ncbi:MAG TPA: proline racemase family protein [Ktedonobacterales bacterium]|nr:proline racemase family protein [Ktedonobacterales bacterium]
MPTMSTPPTPSDPTPLPATSQAPSGGAAAVDPAYPALEVLDMHTGGEPVRIVRGGYPPVVGPTILDKRRYAREHLDHLRRFLMFEPRGHADMYGALLVEPSLPGADLAVLFLHNAGYSTMCGHAVIALGRYAVDYGLVEKTEPVTHVGIECPCGLVRAAVEVRDGRIGRVAFESVPAFLFADGLRVDVPGAGIVTTDVSYGGAFYALADAAQFGLDVRTSRVRDLVDAATALTEAVRAAAPLEHPEHDDLAFLYGSILTDGRERPEEGPSRNICVFADAEVDRSPTGSGVTARMAARVAQGKMELNQRCLFESVTGAVFEGEAVAVTRSGERPAVTVRVSGRAHYSGTARYWLESGDDIGRGFLLR